MTNSTLCKLVSLGLVFAAVGCGGEGDAAVASTTRGVSGRVQAAAGVTVTEVVALASHAGAPTDVYRAAVDAQGAFRLELPKGQRYVLQLMAGDAAIGNIRFAASAGGPFTSLLSMAGAPGASDEAEDEAEAEDDVELGDVQSAGDSDYDTENEPLDQVDSDDDGDSDYADADDDDDGVDDEADEDDDDDGVDDADEDFDSDDDGATDEVDSDDDNDGIEDDADDSTETDSSDL